MPLYAGFDIGIKNLAFCIIESTEWIRFKNNKSNNSGIKLWKNIDLITSKKICMSKTKLNKECNKDAKWINENKYYYCGIHKKGKGKCKSYKNPTSKTISLKTLKKNAFMELDNINIFNDVYCISIETQPKKNRKMQLLASAIESYFIIRQMIDNKDSSSLKIIRSSSSRNKLKIYDGPKINVSHIKDHYMRRKYLAQKQTEYFLQNAPLILEEKYYSNKKRDDLADAFLHCILFL